MVSVPLTRFSNSGFRFADVKSFGIAFHPSGRRHPVIPALRLGSVASSAGLWIQDSGAGWLMISLAPWPVMVSLVVTSQFAVDLELISSQSPPLAN